MHLRKLVLCSLRFAVPSMGRSRPETHKQSFVKIGKAATRTLDTGLGLEQAAEYCTVWFGPNCGWAKLLALNLLLIC